MGIISTIPVQKEILSMIFCVIFGNFESTFACHISLYRGIAVIAQLQRPFSRNFQGEILFY